MTPETFRKRNARDAAIGVVLLVAMAVLAVKQYQWIGQVSEADTNRLKGELRTNLYRFINDFDSEIERMVRYLYSSDPRDTGTDQEILDHRLALWRDFALHPQLVKRAWPAEAPDLPEELRPLAKRLPANVNSFRTGRGNRSQAMLDTSVPAFALLRLGQSTSGPETLRWMIVQLDSAYVRKEWLPELISKNFGTDFHVRLARGRETVYETEPALAKPVEEELSEPLFRASFGRGRGGPLDGGFKGFGPPPSEPGRFTKGDGKGSKGPAKGGGSPVGTDGFREPARGDGFRGDANADPGWRIEVSFQQGTTAELVAGIRTRNLAVSFGILLLMGVSIGILILSTRRANALARQQMEFVAGVTHELRTPLAVILSASQNLADGVTAEESRVRRYGGVIHGQTKRLAGMVEQVLRFAGLSSQHGELQRAPVTVPQLLHEAVTDCRPELDAAGAHLSVHIVPEVPAIDGDRAALLHALRNLLSNAAKHGGGANVRLRAEADPQGVALTVEDDGPGVDAEDLPHLFEPFYRGRRAKQDQVHGSGLGLSLVKKIAEAHHGSVVATSRPGHGTSFRMLLPAVKVG